MEDKGPFHLRKLGSLFTSSSSEKRMNKHGAAPDEKAPF